MKNIGLVFKILIAAALLALAGGGDLAAEGLDFSGTLDSRLSYSAGAGESPGFSMGFETWANIRFQTKLRDYASIYGAVNLIAAAGNIAAAAVSASTAYVSGENYTAALELERLYFRIRGETLQLDTGLLRIPLGYSLVWGPSDFLNPRSPLLPDARTRGVLGASFSSYPTDTLKFLAFASSPKNPLNAEGQGYNIGIGAEKHWDKASLQGFYAYETPQGEPPAHSEYPELQQPSEPPKYPEYPDGRHRAAVSLKADIEVGLTADALYTYAPSTTPSTDGLSCAAGIDYSFFKGNLTAQAEYLYSGKKSATAENLHLANNHYLALNAIYRVNDYTRLNASLMSALDDTSFLPTLGADWEPFQGTTLALSAQFPLDRDTFAHDGNSGELGPWAAQTHAAITLKARLKF